MNAMVKNPDILLSNFFTSKGGIVLFLLLIIL